MTQRVLAAQARGIARCACGAWTRAPGGPTRSRCDAAREGERRQRSAAGGSRVRNPPACTPYVIQFRLALELSCMVPYPTLPYLSSVDV